MKKVGSVQQLYTKRAAFYDRLFIDFLGWGKELASFFPASDYLHPHTRILDAGCGTGIITRVLYQLAQERGYQGIQFHAFDLTQSMLDVLQQWAIENGAINIELRQADVLALEGLPSHWNDYDLIVSSTMLEYLPGENVRAALTNLAQRLRSNGTLLLFITRRTLLTRWLAEKWWKTRVYDEEEIHLLLRDLGFHEIKSRQLSPGWSGSIMVVEASQPPDFTAADSGTTPGDM
jgi:SAM-dependent methyltransferase